MTASERRRWLEELEGGEGITKISRVAGRDIRVVKRHIDIACEEREIAKTRSDFLLNRLEEHQQDLLGEVQRLRQHFKENPSRTLTAGDGLLQKIHQALKQHTSRLPLWQLIESQSKAVSEYTEADDSVRSQLAGTEAELVSHFPKQVTIIPWSTQLVLALKEEIPLKSPTRRYDKNVDTDGYCLPCWSGGALVKSRIPKASLASLLKAHGTLLDRAEQHESLFRRHRQHLRELAGLIMDELDVFVLKRMVPGRCRYCPV